MTRHEFLELMLDFLDAMMKMRYSQRMIEVAIGLLPTLPREDSAMCLKMFSKVAEKKLPEKEFHMEISSIYKKIKGYK